MRVDVLEREVTVVDISAPRSSSLLSPAPYYDLNDMYYSTGATGSRNVVLGGIERNMIVGESW